MVEFPSGGFISTDKLSTSDTWKWYKIVHSGTMKALRAMHSVNLMSVISTKLNGGTGSLDCVNHTDSSKYSANSCRSFPIFSFILSRILSVASLGAILFGCISKHAWSEQTNTQIHTRMLETLYEFVNVRWQTTSKSPIFNSLKNIY